MSEGRFTFCGDTGCVLVLSGTIPGEPGVGGVILGDLVNSPLGHGLKSAAVPTRQAVALGWTARCPRPCKTFIRKYETGWRPFRGIAGEMAGGAIGTWLFRRHCRRLVGEIAAAMAGTTVRRLFAVLDCPTMIQIANEVSEKLAVPLSVMVWDSPELLVDQLRLDRWSARALLKRFERVVRASDRVGVIGEQMKSAYEAKFGPARYIIMRHGADRSQWHSGFQIRSSGTIRIGFAGSITAQQPFAQLVRMLDASDWTVGGRPVTLRLIGSRYTLDSRVPQAIEYFGWRSAPETVRLLSECDFLYLPQPFETHLRDLAELSFPTKLSTYLAAGRPVLLHAPRYASIVPLIEQFPFGRWCDSLDLETIKRALITLCESDAGIMTDAVRRAREAEFSRDVFLSRFDQLCGPFAAHATDSASPAPMVPVKAQSF